MIGVAPIEINTSTGAGVPGGFDASSLKSPSDEVSKLTSQNAVIDSKKAQLQAALAKGDPRVSANDIKKLDDLKASNTTKLNVASKVPDFSSPVKVPPPARAPSVPNFSASGIPDVSTPINGIPGTPEVPIIPVSTIAVVQTAPSRAVRVPSFTKIAADAAAQANSFATIANTLKAKEAAVAANNQARIAKVDEERAITLLNKAKDDDATAAANTDSDPGVRFRLGVEADKFRKQAAPLTQGAKAAAPLAQKFSDMAKAEAAKIQVQNAKFGTRTR